MTAAKLRQILAALERVAEELSEVSGVLSDAQGVGGFPRRSKKARLVEQVDLASYRTDDAMKTCETLLRTEERAALRLTERPLHESAVAP